MTNEDQSILTTVYNYLKLVKPEEKISLMDKYIFIDGPALEFMHIYCKHKKLVVQVTDGMTIPSWFMGLFHLQRITSSDASYIVPMYKMSEFYRYFAIEVKDKDLLNE
jgi:hypothetical protein